ncbi:hypothetical protein COO60DRAFT_1698523 [Scenedesmus sp. NREL 46B-D3]|nr:hypothetical protein COO60DRAFT_1698523 [Scenedesmus sp. NREL 46B-D3]
MKHINSLTFPLLLLSIGLIVSASTAGLGVQAQAQQAAAPAYTSSPTSTSGLRVTIPLWAQSRSSDIRLDFSTADASTLQQHQDQPVAFRGLALNVTHRQGYYHGNVAVARLGSQFVLAVRKIQFYLTLRSQVPDYPLEEDPSKKWVSWWVSRVSLCTADAASLQPLACSDYDPRPWRGGECMWSTGFESLGPEDPRLIVWPGKGLLQYLPEHATQVAGSSSSSSSGGGGASGSRQHGRTHHRRPSLHKEKNWNPFVYNNELYFSQSFDPHVVIKPGPNGTCAPAHQTPSPPLQRLPARPRGNTQAVLLPAAVSGVDADAYIGILHTEVQRQYANYFYMMQASPQRNLHTQPAEPPFRITALSAPIPLVYGGHPRMTAWRHIAFPMSLQLMEESQQLMVGYGSGDQVPRVKLMGVEAVMALFEQGAEAQRHDAAAAGAAGGELD